MNHKLLKPFVALVLLAVLGLACGFNFSTANISNAYMALDEDGAQPTTVYTDDATFFAIAELSNAPDDTVVRAEWFVVSAEGEEPNRFIDEFSLTTGDGVLTFNLSNEPGLLWPDGTYRVDLYLNDELATSLEFQVQ